MIEEQEDTILIQEVLKKNPLAEEKFYYKYKKIIKDYLKRKFPKLNDIDDYVAEILVHIFYKLDKYDPEKSSFKTWVLVVAKHYMIDIWRCNTITPISITNIISGQYSTVTSGSSEWSDGNVFTTNNSGNSTFAINTSCCFSCNNDFENCNSINYISAQISPSDFSLLDMKYVQGYNYNEIGQEFNLSSSTVSNKVDYIKTKLKKNNSDIL
jgi:RNA polymerase sigma factor (sigma-70 family)